ncbi:MAG: J domain-containing protein [Pseudomonadota bacterium]
MSGAVEAGGRRCEHPGCNAPARYRAPHSPERLDEYRWFCLDHVREYNQRWNFFAEHSEDDLAEQWRVDMTWDRPTWKFGSGPKGAQGLHGHVEGKAWARNGFSDPLDVLGAAATLNPGTAHGESRPRRRLMREEQSAMDTLGLPHQVENRSEVRARYRELVKDLHPDMNGGENPDPQRLARVLAAWKILRKSRNFAD